MSTKNAAPAGGVHETGPTKKAKVVTAKDTESGKVPTQGAPPAMGMTMTDNGTHGELSRYPTNPTFLRTLIRMKANQLSLADGKIFVCQRGDKIVDVWRGLIKHNFLSAPVIQKTGSKYYGFVDQIDIVKYVMRLFGEAQLKGLSKGFWEMVDEEEFFKSRTIKDIMTYPLSLRNPYHPVHREFSLYFVCELLARENHVERIPIVDDNRNLVHLVTLSRIVEFLSRNLEQLGEVRHKPVSLLRRLEKQVVIVKESDTAMHSFTLMTEKNTSGVAIVNDEGRLSGVLSLKDLKAIHEDARMFWRLFETNKNYIQKVRNETPADDRPRNMVFVKNTDTLENVLKKLSENKIHRLFVVDDEKKPIGVVNLKDVLYEIISN